MNPSEALFYPSSYYKDIAACSADYMTRLFTGHEPYTYEQHEGWQDRLHFFIQRILLSARLDESAAIGAMVLLENFHHAKPAAERPVYPSEEYFAYFMGAYMMANRILAPKRTLHGIDADAFWLDVIGSRMFTQREVEDMETNFRESLGENNRISSDAFFDVKVHMHAFIHLRMLERSGSFSGAEEMKLSLEHPPCHAEMKEREALFNSIRLWAPELQKFSDRDFYNFIMRESCELGVYLLTSRSSS